MLNTIKLLTLMLFCAVFLEARLGVAQAQEPVEAEAAPLVIQPSGRLDLTFKDFGYTTRQLNRDLPRRFYGIDLPQNFQISATGNYLELITSHFPATPDKPAVLRVSLNDTLLTTLPLTATNAISIPLRLDLPDGLFKTGLNSFAFDLDTNKSCEEDGALVDLVIDEASLLNFGYQQQAYPTDLGRYPFPFDVTNLFKVPVTIVLPDRPTSADLSAAATIAAGLGRETGGQVELATISANELSPEVRANHHLIIIGTLDSNSLLSDLSLPLTINNTNLKPGQGVLQELVSPWNNLRLILVVSGLDNQGIFKASQALNRQANFLGMHGPVAIVLDLLPLSEQAETPLAADVSMTLASLGYRDQIAYGAAHKDLVFDFRLPLGWQLQEQPYFVLKFAHADILDPVQSILDVKLNNTPIGSTLLDPSNATEGELSIPIPRRLLQTGRNQLSVGIEMGLPGGDLCSNLEDQRAWTIVSSDSEIFLPYNALDVPPDLDLFPYPFSQNPALDHTVLVVPDQPSAQLLEAAIKLATRLGSPVSSSKDISMNVVYASEMDQARQKEHHFILLGRPTQNQLLAEINKYLPQPFTPDTDSPEPLVVDSVAFLPDPNRDAGLVEIINSPWDEKYTLLAVTGTTDRGVELAIQALLSQPDQLGGNLAVVEPMLDPLTDDANQIKTYSIDTRPPALIDEEASLSGNPISEDNLARLSERWWR